jgi:hypothetical protein
VNVGRAESLSKKRSGKREKEEKKAFYEIQGGATKPRVNMCKDLKKGTKVKNLNQKCCCPAALLASMVNKKLVMRFIVATGLGLW